MKLLSSALLLTSPMLSGANRHLVLQEDLVGTYLKSVVDYGDHHGENDNIEINDGSGRIYTITNPGKSGWAKEQGLRSGVSTIIVGKGASVNGATIDMNGSPPKGKPEGPGNHPFDRNLKEDKLEIVDQRRRLATVIGTKPVMAVKVIHTGPGSLGTTTNTKEVIADSIFGAAVNGSDRVNLHSQFKACSHGQLEMVPAADQSSNDADVSNIVNGVAEVTVNTDCTTTPCDGAIRNDVNAALGRAFGSNIRGGDLANHVMHCLPPGAMSGIAYAFINSWNSVYSDRWCEYPSAQVHEIGHNLNLAHSNEGTTVYADQTGFMGYSYSQDEQQMCYNNAKNWQLGWFNGATQVVLAGTGYDGPIKGQINYDVSAGSQTPVVVKVEDYYIGFNHKAKHNIDTAEAGNQVTIQRYSYSGDTPQYAESWLVAKLSSGGEWSVNINGSLLTVRVNSITPDPDTGVAQVSISYGLPDGPTSSPNSNPTYQPTPKPTSAPTRDPTIFPTVASSSPTFNPTNQPTPKPTSAPTHDPTNFPTVASSSPTSIPTNQPTPKPTSAPTRDPTNFPTVASSSPTSNPTNQPTPKPTSAPTRDPTNFPTEAPTLPGFCTDGSGRCSDVALGHPTTDLSGCACSTAIRLLVSHRRRHLQSCEGLDNKACRSTGCRWAGGQCNPVLAPTTSEPTDAPTPNPTNASVPTSNPTDQPTFLCGCALTASPTAAPITAPTSSPMCAVCGHTGLPCCGTCVDSGKPSKRGCFFNPN